MKQLLISFIICLFLSGCGVKPGAVDPPDDGQNNVYPRTYPDLSTDPQ